MKNEIVGCLFFVFLILGVLLGNYFNQMPFFGILGLGFGLGVILIFRKKH